MADEHRFSVDEVNAEIARRCGVAERDLGAAMILDWPGRSAEALDLLAPAVLVLAGDPRSSRPIERAPFGQDAALFPEFAAVVNCALVYMNRLNDVVRGGEADAGVHC